MSNYRPRMRPDALLAEAVADVLTGAARPFVNAAVLVVISLLVVMDLRVVADQAERARDIQSSGGAVYILVATGNVDARACEALGNGRDVWAGALRDRATPAVPSRLPGSTLPVKEATAGLLPVLLGGRTVTDGILLGSDAATSLGVTRTPPAGSAPQFVISTELELQEGVAEVAAIYPWPDDGRRTGLSYAAVIPVPTDGTFDECWVSTWPQREDIDVLVRTALSSNSADSKPQVLQLNSRHGTALNLNDAFISRVSRYATVLMVVFSALLGWLSVRLRRLELASDLNAGVARSDLTAKLLVETCFSCLPAIGLIAAAGAWCVQAAASADRAALWNLTLAGCAAILAAPLLGTVLGIGLVRERHLMNYSRER